MRERDREREKESERERERERCLAKVGGRMKSERTEKKVGRDGESET